MSVASDAQMKTERLFFNSEYYLPNSGIYQLLLQVRQVYSVGTPYGTVEVESALGWVTADNLTSRSEKGSFKTIHLESAF